MSIGVDFEKRVDNIFHGKMAQTRMVKEWRSFSEMQYYPLLSKLNSKNKSAVTWIMDFVFEDYIDRCHSDKNLLDNCFFKIIAKHDEEAKMLYVAIENIQKPLGKEILKKVLLHRNSSDFLQNWGYFQEQIEPEKLKIAVDVFNEVLETDGHQFKKAMKEYQGWTYYWKGLENTLIKVAQSLPIQKSNEAMLFRFYENMERKNIKTEQFGIDHAQLAILLDKFPTANPQLVEMALHGRAPSGSGNRVRM